MKKTATKKPPATSLDKAAPPTPTALATEQEQAISALLDSAKATVLGQRQADYGDKLDNFTQIAMVWTGLLARKLAYGVNLTADDVVTLMQGMKLTRLSYMPRHKDSSIDVVGYEACRAALQNTTRPTPFPGPSTALTLRTETAKVANNIQGVNND